MRGSLTTQHFIIVINAATCLVHYVHLLAEEIKGQELRIINGQKMCIYVRDKNYPRKLLDQCHENCDLGIISWLLNTFFIYNGGVWISWRAPRLIHRVPAISHQHKYQITLSTKA